jgi:hypothetical protein
MNKRQESDYDDFFEFEKAHVLPLIDEVKEFQIQIENLINEWGLPLNKAIESERITTKLYIMVVAIEKAEYKGDYIINLQFSDGVERILILGD